MPLFGPVPGCPVRPRNHYAVHADPGKPVPSVSASWEPPLRRSVGVTSDASAPDHPSVAPGKPCARSGVAVWRFAPPEPAFTSWTEPVFRLPPPCGFVRQTRCLSPGRHALSGTSLTFANVKPQVKGYFRIPRVIPRTFCLLTRNIASSTVRAQVCPQPERSIRYRGRRFGVADVDGTPASGLNEPSMSSTPGLAAFIIIP